MSRADMVLKEIEAITEKEFLPIIGPDRGQVLIKVIRRTRPKRILEIGTFVGYSTIMMAKELDANSCLTTIEIHADRAKLARENIRKANVRPKVDVIVGDAVKVIPKLTEKFDMVFIDAAKEEYFDYLKLVEKKLHKGSVIVADNVGFFADQTKEYLDYVRSSGKYKSEYTPFGKDGVEVSVKQ
ncbi:MAG: O-methyltransferase [Candidatus Bathyarchaeia archaeon]